MSKFTKVAALGLAAGAAVLPLAGFASAVDNQFVDNLSVTIDEVCTLTRDSSAAHTDGTATSGKGTWSETGDTLSKTITAGSADLTMGSSKFHVACNHTDGYKVTLATSGLKSTSKDADVIPYITSASAPTVSNSNWAIAVGGNYILDGGTVDTTTAPLANAGTDFTVTYAIAVKDGQPAGTYNGTATYTLAQL